MRTGIRVRRYSARCRRPPSSRCSGRPASARRASRSRSPSGCAPTARTRSPCRPTRCRSTAGSRRSPAPPPQQEQAQLEHRLLSFLPVDAPFSAGAYARLAHREIDDLLGSGRPPDRGRRHRPVPARGARRARPAAAGPAGHPRAPPCRARRARAAGAARGARRAAHPAAAAVTRPTDPQRIVRALELLDAGHSPPAGAAAVDHRHAPSDAARRPDDGARGAQAADRRARRRDGGGRRARRGPGGGAGASVTARKALGFRELLAGDVEAHEDRHPPLRPPPAHVDAQAARRDADRRHRAPTARRTSHERCATRWHDPRVRFEKWQALGNDYLIVERADAADRGRSSAHAVRPPLRRRRRRRARARRRPTSRASSRAPADLQPGRLRGRAVRQRRAPGDPLPAPPRLDGRPTRFSIQTIAGEIRPTITGPTTCRVDMGRATLTSKDYPGGPPDGTRRRSRATASSTSRSATRSARSASRTATTLDALDLRRSARASSTRRCSRTARTPRSGPSSSPARIRARIFERGAGETLSSGTGACGAAVAHVLRGGDSPVTVVLDGGELDRRRRRVAARRPHRLGRAGLPRASSSERMRPPRRISRAADRRAGPDRP